MKLFSLLLNKKQLTAGIVPIKKNSHHIRLEQRKCACGEKQNFAVSLALAGQQEVPRGSLPSESEQVNRRSIKYSHTSSSLHKKN